MHNQNDKSTGQPYLEEPQQSISPDQYVSDKAPQGKPTSQTDSKSLLHGVNYSFSQQHFQALQAEKAKQQLKGVNKQQQNKPPPGPIRDSNLPMIESPVPQQQTTPVMGQGKYQDHRMTPEQLNVIAEQSSNQNATFSKERNSVSMASVQNAIETSGIHNTFTEALQESARIKNQKQKKGPNSRMSGNDVYGADPLQTKHLPEMKTQQNFMPNQVKLLPNPFEDGNQPPPTLPPTSYRPSGRVTSIERNQEIMQEMQMKGFRPASRENQFEYDSDSVEKYDMISNEFDYESVRLSDTFGIKQYRDCLYRGQLDPNTRQREGCGVIVYKNGRIYEGEWSQNLRHGRGYEVFANGNTYQGAYQRGKPTGKGVYTWKNGEVYDGEWLQGVKNGYGVWKGLNGESYIGQWQDSKAQGYGVHVWGNGDKYEGEWLGSLRHGNGSDFFTNGDVFVGQYINGKPEGFGQYKWANGSSYTGQFKGGVKDGHGKWKKKQTDEMGNTKCNAYEGQYVNDKKHGHGTFEWESGNIYVGSYVEDERQGYGVMRWTDGSTYMGTWHQGIQEGIGVMIFPDGTRRAGLFEQNVFKASIKSLDQIEPYVDQVDPECYQQLEQIVIQREKEIRERDQEAGLGQNLLQVNDSLETSIKSSKLLKSGGLNQSRDEKSVPRSPTEVFDDSKSQISQINKKMKVHEKEDKNQTMQKGAPMKKFKTMHQQMPSEAEIKHDVKNVLKRYGGTRAPLPQQLALSKRGPPVNLFLQKNMPESIPKDAPKEVPSPTSKKSSPAKSLSLTGKMRSSKPSLQNSGKKLQITSGQQNLGRTTMAVQTDLNMNSMAELAGANSTQPLKPPTSQFIRQTTVANPGQQGINQGQYLRQQTVQPQIQNQRANQEAANRRWASHDPVSQGQNAGKSNEAELEAERMAQYNFANPDPGMINQNSFANQLPNSQFLDTKINENIMMSGPPNESDSDFNRNSSMMVRSNNEHSQRKQKRTGQGSKKLRGTNNGKAFGQNQGINQAYESHSQPKIINQPSELNTLTDPRNNNNYSPIAGQGPAAAYLNNHHPSATIEYQNMLSPIFSKNQSIDQKRDSSLDNNLRGNAPWERGYDQNRNNLPVPRLAPAQMQKRDSSLDHRNQGPAPWERQNTYGQPMQEGELYQRYLASHYQKENQQKQQLPPQGFHPQARQEQSDRKSRQNLLSQISAADQRQKQAFNQTQSMASSIGSAYANQGPPVLQNPGNVAPANVYLPEIRNVNRQQKTQAQNTPVQRPNLKAFHDTNRNAFEALKAIDPRDIRPQVEEVLTPSPQEKSSHHQSFQQAFNRSLAQSSNHGGVTKFNISGEKTPNEPMSQVEHDPDQRNSTLTRGRSVTSSQRTLRYNDFELVQKAQQNKEEYEVHLDDGDEKQSAVSRPQDKEGGSSNYPDFQRSQYVHQKPQQLVSSQDSLVNQPRHSGALAKERRLGGSNDTQLASHTHAMQYAGLGSIDESGNGNMRRIQRSVPVQHTKDGKIRINQNILIPDDYRVRKVNPGVKNSQSPPGQRMSEKPPRRKKDKGDNSNSRKRIIDMRGPYAQNLIKPKLQEVRGLQKIAIKNQLQQNWQKPMGYNSEVVQHNYLSSQNQHSSSGGVGYSDSKPEERSGRFGSLGAKGSQNFVIQHQMISGGSKMPQSLDTRMLQQQRKRVWVPNNAKRSLKQMQVNMQQASNASSNLIFGGGAKRSP